ncbi:hypothetical protein KIW84_010407 [Lathyrus oleraceus]|uniref:methionine adenosyltransferase n=1 Tax=Pisum sativum TaxID=3888 RepID=A0A9D4YPI4_PEA|nr:hypothetical protein KIW84_010407 [Pisum sativum]
MATETFLFTSESVNEGHPDKLCDQISDAVLDACLEQDPESKVACETCTKTNMVMVFGEITTKANVDYEKIVRDTCRNIGFVSDDVGLDADNCKVLVNIEQQSPDIAQGVHGHLTKRPEEIGAGDQGHMFGYATDETPEFMPLSHVLATKLGAKLTEVRKNGTCPWLRPDGKTQVTVEYYNDKGAMVPIRVHTVLISTQHDETVTNDEIAADLKEHVIKPVIPEKEILNIVKEAFDFRPGMISISLDLLRGGNGRFLKTAAYGHFGRDDADFTWEVVKPLKGGKLSTSA